MDVSLSTVSCPSQKILAQFHAGGMTGDGLETLSAHVEACPKCKERMERLKEGGGSSSERSERNADPTEAETSIAPDPRMQETTVGSPSRGSDAPEDPIPERLGRYRVLRRLGRGAMGAVLLGLDEQLDRHVALKVPHLNACNMDQVERFAREARTAATLRHPNICPVYDVGEADGVPYIAMAYIEGRSMAEFRGQALPLRQAVLAVRKIALALDHAHRHGVVHRDLKPSNIMIDREQGPIVMDFGLARWLDDDRDERLTQSGAILGTPSYMSPEQVEGNAATGPASDVFSLGVILYESLTGRLPFVGNVVATLKAIAANEPPAPRSLRAEIPPALEAVCLRMLRKDPKERLATMADVAVELSRALDALPAGRDSADSSRAESPPRPEQKTRLEPSPRKSSTTLPATAPRHTAAGSPARRTTARRASGGQKSAVKGRKSAFNKTTLGIVATVAVAATVGIAVLANGRRSLPIPAPEESPNAMAAATANPSPSAEANSGSPPASPVAAPRGDSDPETADPAAPSTQVAGRETAPQPSDVGGASPALPSNTQDRATRNPDVGASAPPRSGGEGGSGEASPANPQASPPARSDVVSIVVDVRGRRRTYEKTADALPQLLALSRSKTKSAPGEISIAVNVDGTVRTFDDATRALDLVTRLDEAARGGRPLSTVMVAEGGAAPSGAGGAGSSTSPPAGGGNFSNAAIDKEMKEVQSRVTARLNAGEAGIPPTSAKVEQILREEMEKSQKAGRLPVESTTQSTYTFGGTFGSK